MTSTEAEAIIRQHHKVPDDAAFRARCWRTVGGGLGQKTRLAVCLASKEYALPGFMPSPTDLSWWYCVELPVKPKADKPLMLDPMKARAWVYALEEQG